VIATVAISVPRDGDPAAVAGRVAAAVAPARLVRWAVVGVAADRLLVEAAVWEAASAGSFPGAGLVVPGAGGGVGAGLVPVAGSFPGAGLAVPGTAPAPGAGVPGGAGPFGAALILPTGIGLETGGYAGDGTPAANLLAAACDHLVTHPNAVNAAALNWAAGNVAYVEGALLDAWLAGELALRRVRANRVGLLIDRGVADSGGMPRIDNAAHAFRMVGGGSLEALLTAEPLDLGLAAGASGASYGSLGNPDLLLAGARTLVARGAQAVAIVGDFSRLDLDATAYLAGAGPDPVGGLEAILSHLVARELGVACAHAPWLRPSADPCDPRAAAEELGSTFLLSVLRGLQRAPRPMPAGARSDPAAAAWSDPAAGPGRAVFLPDPAAVVAPATALGGPGVLAAAARGIPIVAVRNPSALDVGAADLGLRAIPAASYLEAAGILLALREGIDPLTLGRDAVGSPAGGRPATRSAV